MFYLAAMAGTLALSGSANTGSAPTVRSAQDHPPRRRHVGNNANITDLR